MVLLLKYATKNSIYVRGNLGNAPLFIAAFNDSIGEIELLLECGAVLDEENNFNYSSLHLAAMSKRWKYY